MEEDGDVHRFRRRADAEAVFHMVGGLPARIRELLRPVRFVTEYDPAFLGIHALGKAADGRAYAATSHCVWPHALGHRPATDRNPTIFLQRGHAHRSHVVLHELGHALDWALGWYRKPVTPLDAYAARNRAEAFATAFQSWSTPDPLPGLRFYHDAQTLRARDPATATFFDGLARA